MRRLRIAAGRCAAVLGACLAMGTPVLRAQAPDSSRNGHRGLAGLTRAALLVTATALVVAPLDGGIARSLEASSASHASADAAARTTGQVGGLGAPLLDVGLLTVGALTGHHDMADAGWHAGLSLAIASGLTMGLKTVIGRARPATAPWSDPGERGPDSDEFRPVTTSGAWASFPSGHTTAAFATAAALSAEVRRHDPHTAHIVAPLLYTGAGLVGLSRMYNNQHWASDVAAGAVIGILVGHEVVARAHDDHPSLAGHLVPSVASISPHGAGVAWSFTLR